METSNRDAKTAGPIAARTREVIMPHMFNRFYENATGWLYDFDPGTLPVTEEALKMESAETSAVAARRPEVVVMLEGTFGWRCSPSTVGRRCSPGIESI